MAFRIRFNEEKNQLLKATRKIDFEDVIRILKKEGALDDLVHPNKRYFNQRIYVVRFNNYVFAVPYVINRVKREIFLKTIYPSRILTRKYLQGGRK